MGLVKGTVHGLASMIIIVLGAIIAGVVRDHVGIFESLSEGMVTLLVETANLPVSEEVAAIAVPVGILIGVWVALFEFRQAMN